MESFKLPNNTLTQAIQKKLLSQSQESVPKSYSKNNNTAIIFSNNKNSEPA